MGTPGDLNVMFNRAEWKKKERGREVYVNLEKKENMKERETL